MTYAKEILLKYIEVNYNNKNIISRFIENDKVVIIKENGDSVILTCNIYGDIIDDKTNKIIAISDLPHDVINIGYELPKKWKLKI